MGRETREIWTKRVERWRDSGLSAAEFAAEIGINVASLRNWSWRLNSERRRIGGKDPPVGAEPLSWVEVAAALPEAAPKPARPADTADKLELVLASGLLVRVPTEFEPEALRRLLAVVG